MAAPRRRPCRPTCPLWPLKARSICRKDSRHCHSDCDCLFPRSLKWARPKPAGTPQRSPTIPHVWPTDDNLSLDRPSSPAHRRALHTIRQILYRDAILRNTFMLTPEEFRADESHTVKEGGTAPLCPALEIALRSSRNHHDRLDGSGCFFFLPYPRSAAATKIPLLARLMSVRYRLTSIPRTALSQGMQIDEALVRIDAARAASLTPRASRLFGDCDRTRATVTKKKLLGRKPWANVVPVLARLSP